MGAARMVSPIAISASSLPGRGWILAMVPYMGRTSFGRIMAGRTENAIRGSTDLD
jgi:hypothetical protein